MIINYLHPTKLIFNVGISCDHPAFNYIRRVVEAMESYSGKAFHSINNFLAILNTY